MIHFDPPVLISPMQSVEAGSIVRWDANAKNVGFCVVSANDPRKGLAVFDDKTKLFTWLYADVSNVVNYGKDVVVIPAIDSFEPEIAIQGPRPTLFTLEGAPHVTLIVGNDMRFLNLSTGEFKSFRGWPLVGGYGEWKAGVRGMDGNFIEQMSVR